MADAATLRQNITDMLVRVAAGGDDEAAANGRCVAAEPGGRPPSWVPDIVVALLLRRPRLRLLPAPQLDGAET
jgi:hypothetical protein